MAGRHETEHKSFGEPDDIRQFPNGRAEILRIGEGEVGRLVFEPGWRWSNDVKPIAKTESCEAPHFQYHISGRLAIRMDDGTEVVAGPGDVTSLPSGHDAWVVGDEPAVVVDWYGQARTRRQADLVAAALRKAPEEGGQRVTAARCCGSGGRRCGGRSGA